MTNIKERVSYILEYKGIAKEDFYKEIGMSSSSFRGSAKNTPLNSIAVANILSILPDINPMWLLSGKGEMLQKDNSYKTTTNEIHIVEEPAVGFSCVPYWDLAVSAGHSLTEIKGKRKADGYVVGLPGAEIAENLFPVTGMSMEPEISPAAIIGVRKMENWETLNTERIYLIITRDDRMIKRIEYDAENEDIIWCVSPNYPRFKIYKSDIIEVQRVCFVYNPK